MRASAVVITAAILAACASAYPQVKGVKGGHDGAANYFQINQNLSRFYPGFGESQTSGGSQIQQHQQQSYPVNVYYGNNVPGSPYNNGTLVSASQTAHNNTKPRDYTVGVCYIEVPTVQLARDPHHIPAGNGSTPEYSRIRSCCKGYIRNIHNYKICDPVCREECVNGLCTAPDVCTCFPDHVRNLAGFCVPTCPIGCQNGRCAGGECLCDEGYTLDDDSKYCRPVCLEKCSGIGNCTAPNTCACNNGYKSGPRGTCVPPCDSCEHGECVGLNQCRCRPGYVNSGPGRCVPTCVPECGPNRQCISPNTCSGCPSGFENDVATGRCVPHQVQLPTRVSSNCDVQCINGVCNELNECTCNPGYVKDTNYPVGTRCIPHCPGGCMNGVCTLPNHCICNLGFMKDFSVKGRPTCVRRVRRSVDQSIDEKESSVLEGLTFEIPDY